MTLVEMDKPTIESERAFDRSFTHVLKMSGNKPPVGIVMFAMWLHIAQLQARSRSRA